MNAPEASTRAPAARIVAGGLCLALASWTALILIPTHSTRIGRIDQMTETATTDPATGEFKAAKDDTLLPQTPNGAINQGARTYVALGCAECHTQQVTHPALGTDFECGFGRRHSVPRDYLHARTAAPGTRRIGPDLANAGVRLAAASDAELLAYLYNPRASKLHPGSTAPAHPGLFREIAIEPDAPAPANALRIPPALTQPGTAIVPTHEALTLLAYLRSLDQDYDLPEAIRAETKPAPARKP